LRGAGGARRARAARLARHRRRGRARACAPAARARRGRRQPEGEGHRQLRGDEMLARQQAGLGRTDEHAAAWREQAQQHLQGARLRRRVEIDQHVAAEDVVVQRAPGQEVGREQVALLQAHARARVFAELPAPGAGAAEVTVAEGQVAAAEGVDAVLRALAECQRARADVDAVDAETVRRQPASSSAIAIE
jgi:hypothetical protein